MLRANGANRLIAVKLLTLREDEAFPAIGGDDKIYFASRGLPGMGGYDIFSARVQEVPGAAQLNLRYPVNSTSDDFIWLLPMG